jgi:predicted nuclease of predicted toxin-antitoxin system
VRIKLDENLPGDAVGLLAGLGHDVDTVVTEGLGGAQDGAVVVAAAAAERLLVTLDRGLGDIRSYPPGAHAGIVVLRVDDQSAPALVETLRSLAENHDLADFKRCVVVVRQHLVRIRRPQ